MNEEKREELYFAYQSEQARLAEELEAYARKQREWEDEKAGDRKFYEDEQRKLEQHGQENGYGEDFQEMRRHLEDCMFKRDIEMRRREEELQQTGRELRKRQRESEDRYREAINRLETEAM